MEQNGIFAGAVVRLGVSTSRIAVKTTSGETITEFILMLVTRVHLIEVTTEASFI